MPTGKEAIDRIIRAGRFDLIENILRGYNPGGRVYAALALKAWVQKGRKLTPVETELIQKIASLDTPIDTCFGCLFGSETAGEILAHPAMIDPRGWEERPKVP